MFSIQFIKYIECSMYGEADRGRQVELTFAW